MSATPREVVARALVRRWHWEGNAAAMRIALADADAVFAALATDPDTVERAARAIEANERNIYIPRSDDSWRRTARAALSAALTPPQEDA